ncbi:hypothetical protein Hamer_G003170 [Homarus americanus]|uniref:Uncharacterized protein n=1 Tax=Homarus americanus TaxID=6706 RepID=A0A8J5TL07_HOMAM|nr:hypothetical protein Hamer_G003170 [Homarus americanus]
MDPIPNWPPQTRLYGQPRKILLHIPFLDDASTITTGRIKTLRRKAVRQIVNEEGNEQPGASVSVRHSDKHCDIKILIRQE